MTSSGWTQNTVFVPPNSKREFVVHSTASLSIYELPEGTTSLLETRGELTPLAEPTA